MKNQTFGAGIFKCFFNFSQCLFIFPVDKILQGRYSFSFLSAFLFVVTGNACEGLSVF